MTNPLSIMSIIDIIEFSITTDLFFNLASQPGGLPRNVVEGWVRSVEEAKLLELPLPEHIYQVAAGLRKALTETTCSHMQLADKKPEVIPEGAVAYHIDLTPESPPAAPAGSTFH